MLRAVSFLGRTSTLSSIFLGVVVRGAFGREESGKALRGLLTLRVPTILGESNFFASFFWEYTFFWWGTGIFCAGHPSFLSRLVASAAADTLCLAAVKDDEGTAVLSFGDCVKSRRRRKKRPFLSHF